jgi:predicted peptidase
MMGARSLSVLVVSLSLVASAPAGADEVKTGFLQRVHKGADGKEARYALFVPHDYRGNRAYPLILFLHGAGEWGSDGQKQLSVGLGPAVKKRAKAFPFLVLFPQSQKNTWPVDVKDPKQLRRIATTWSDQEAEGQRALALLADVEKEYRVDPERVYLTGVSMGGFGTWLLAASHPERWAAIVPICGGGDPRTAARIKGLPCWCFHGDADDAVPVHWSRDMMKALWAAGGHPNYTEYAGVGHNSWDKAYDTTDLYEWLLRHRLKKKP